MSKNPLNLTTKEGIERAYIAVKKASAEAEIDASYAMKQGVKIVIASSLAIAGTGGLAAIPIGVVGAIGFAGIGIAMLKSSEATAREQVEQFKELVCLAKEKGAKKISCKMSREAGLSLDTEIAGIPIKTSFGTKNTMDVEVTF